MIYSAILRKLLDDLIVNNVFFVSWKNNHELNMSLSGMSDLDILIDQNYYIPFTLLATKSGFHEAFNLNLSYPSVFHFYCYDSSIDKIIHLHLYVKLVTGESHLKNFHFPIEDKIIGRAVNSELGIAVPCALDQLKLILLRHYIKISCLPGAFLFFREIDSYRAEIELCLDNFSDNKIDFTSSIYDNYVLDNIDYDLLLTTYKLGFFRQVIHGIKLRFTIRGFQRYGFFSSLLARYKQIVYRFLNKLFFKRKKRFSFGALIAITGLDGAGKSSTVSDLISLFSKHFDCRTVHVGLPAPTLVTFPFRIGLGLFKLLKKFKPNSDELTDRNFVTDFPEKSTGFLMAIRYCILSYERYRAVRKAKKLTERGVIVISDRYPSKNFGVMDSRRILANNTSPYIVKLLSRIEQSFYAYCSKPDILLNLVVPMEVSISRNKNRVKSGKETDEEIIERYRINSELEYDAYYIEKIDMNGEKDACLRRVRDIVWKNLRG